MNVRKLGEGPRSNKPDRSKATWGTGTPTRNTTPQQMPVAGEKKQIPREQGPPIRNSEKGNQRSSRATAWDNEDKQEVAKAPPWIAATLVLACCAFVGLILFAFLRNDSDEVSVATEPKGIDIETEIENMNLKPDEGPLPHKIAMQFARTSDRAERLKLARDPERVAALIDSFPPQAVSETTLKGAPMGEVIAGDLSVLRFRALFDNGESRIVFVVRTEDGPKVDWEAYARHSGALLRWMEEGKDAAFEREEETAEVRVHAIRDNHFNFRFSDEEVWQAYQLASPDMDEGAIAYVKAGSPTAKILEQELTVEKRVTLQLKSRIDDARNRQFEIEKVLAIGWVKTDDDFEKRWFRENGK